MNTHTFSPNSLPEGFCKGSLIGIILLLLKRCVRFDIKHNPFIALICLCTHLEMVNMDVESTAPTFRQGFGELRIRLA